jgi:ZipA, C-terminal FtsZ-binding domain
MSELQISLLGIGAAVVVAVYGYSVWQQHQYRRRFGAAFKPHRDDALYQPATGGAAQAGDDSGIGAVEPLSGPAGRTGAADDACSALDAATDYIVVLASNTPMSAGALAPLWQQRFDFGKNVNVCGLNTANGEMERVVAESMHSYSELHLALQLADRSGAVNESRLKAFHDLAREAATLADADAAMPDVAEAAEHARQLDAFCAEVDQMIGLNILPGGDRLLAGAEIALAAEMHGFALQADGSFHLLDEQGHTLFTLANYDSEPFQHHTIKQMRAGGLSLLLDVPRVQHPLQRFDEMFELARKIGMELRAAVVDDHRVALSETAVAMIRGQVAAIENKMLEYPVVPGSAQARRLFS